MHFRRRPPRPTVSIDGSSFVIAANGYAEGPSQPLARFLSERGAHRVTTLTHPLTPDGPREHRVETILDGVPQPAKVVELPNRPPATYAFDPIVPLVPPRADAWFGFNCVATAQGIAHRSAGRVGRVVHWNIDFVPDRFGTGLLTRVYDRLDAFCCRRADGRVELSDAARVGRIRRYGLAEDSPVEIIPMGAWAADVPVATADNFDARRVLFLGSLVERMGVDVLVDAVAILHRRGTPVQADIVGGGDMHDEIRRRIDAAGLADEVTMHGFVEDFADVLEIVASASVAVAPYRQDPDSFTQFADPGKLKAYLSAGLPILLTDVPPNAADLAASGGAEIVSADPERFADRIAALLDDRDEWTARHDAALTHAKGFDWEYLFERSLPGLGIASSADPLGDSGTSPGVSDRPDAARPPRVGR